MAITLGQNISAIANTRYLDRATSQVSKTFERLSSGLRINRASDDAAGLAVATGLNVSARVFSQGLRNLNDGLSALNIADGALEGLTGIVTRLRELAGQAANGSFSFTQRASLDIEAQQLAAEYQRVSQSTKFNQLSLLDGSVQGLLLQGGFGADGLLSSSVGGKRSAGTFTKSNQLTGVAVGLASSATGDINGDGYTDVVTAQSSGTVSIQLGQAGGGFLTSQTLSGHGVVALGDTNGDGKLDLVFDNTDANSIQIYSNDGSGRFTLSSELSGDVEDLLAPDTTGDVGALGGPLLKLGDLNGDGVLDLAYTARNKATGASELRVRLNDGRGGFAQSSVAKSYSNLAGNSITDFALGDLDGDGRTDIAVFGGGDDGTFYLNTTLQVLWNSGSGTFNTSSTLPLGGFGSERVALGDFNGDGKLDIAASFWDGDQNYTLYTARNLGGRNFGTLTAAGIGSTAAIVIGDLSGDGQVDIAQGTKVLFNQGGAFSYTRGITLSPSASVYNIADLNNDGVPDLFTNGGLYSADTQDGVQPITPFSLKTAADAFQAFAQFQPLSDRLALQRGVIGAAQSRISSALRTLSSSTEAYTQASARIRDLDVAENAAELTRQKILQQGAALIASTVNQQPALALVLLR